ncbi:MAG: glycosyltransferase family 8 protein [Candidatus Ancillula sp.]|jgi:lipopolysaccharide biosynthesis glycosyltransferase|nr:glycosyltransferase family 8 protein [Candidatus Ancillula sp.]
MSSEVQETERDRVSLGYSTSDLYAKYLPVQLWGVLENNADLDFDIYVFTDYISDINIERIDKVLQHFGNAKIKYIKVENSIFEEANTPQWNGSYATYYKLLFEKKLPEVERILHLDIDTICQGSLRPLLSIDMKGKLIAARTEGAAKKHVNSHGLEMEEQINAGVVLFDLRAIRAANLGTDFLLKVFVENSAVLEYPEQDILNLVYANNIRYFDETYNRRYWGDEPLLHHRRTKSWVLEQITWHILKPKPWTLPRWYWLGRAYRKVYLKTKVITGDLGYEQPTRLDSLKKGEMFNAFGTSWLCKLLYTLKTALRHNKP